MVGKFSADLAVGSAFHYQWCQYGSGSSKKLQQSCLCR